MKLARNPGALWPAAAPRLIRIAGGNRDHHHLDRPDRVAVMRNAGPGTENDGTSGNRPGWKVPVRRRFCNRTYGVSYIPAAASDYGKYYADYSNPALGGGTQLDIDSVAYLSSVFHSGGQKFITKWQTTGINWNSSWSLPTAPAHPAEQLEGEQCLVFFLGGIQATGPNGCLGFSSDDANPDNLGGSRNSFFEFKSNRLVVPPVPNATFFAYQDPYDKGGIYAYFSAYGVTNNYNKYAATTTPAASDCATLGVWPYAESGHANSRVI